MKTILVIGGASLLGQYLIGEAEAAGYAVHSTFNREEPTDPKERHRLDFTDAQMTEKTISRLAPDAVFLPAAMTNVDECERNPSEAWRVNVEGTLNVASACQRIGAKLLYVSTDYVFNGQKAGAYREVDAPDPLSVYAKTKLEGEMVVKDASPHNLVCRVCVLYGWNLASKKSNFVTWVIDSLRQGKEVRLLTDQCITPTYAPHIASAMVELMRLDAAGVLHTSGGECLSRHDMGQRIAEVFELDPGLIRPADRSQMSFVAVRPDRSCLSVRKVEGLLGTKMITFTEGLIDMRSKERMQ